MGFNKYDKGKLLLLLLFVLLLVQGVAAQNVLDTITENPILKGLSVDKIKEVYNGWWWLVDFAFYAVILGKALTFAGKNQFGGQGGKMLGTVLALMLAGGAVFFESQTTFRLGNLGVIGLGLALLVLGKMMWDILDHLNLGRGKKVIGGILYLTLYAIVFLPLTTKYADQDYMKYISLAVNVGAFVALVMLVMGLFDLGRLFRRGGAYGGGEGGGIGGLFGGRRGGGGGSNPRAAVAAEQQAAVGEQVVGQEEEVERRQEQREVADISAIQNLTKREIKDVDRIRSDIDGVIKVLKKGRLDAAAQQEIAQKIGEIVPSAIDIRGVEQQLRARIADLDAVERTEIANIEQMARTAKGVFMNDIRAMRQSQSLQNRQPGSVAALLPYKKNLDTAQSKFIDQSKGIAFKQLASTRRKLESHANAISQLEAQFAQDYTQARQYLMSGALQQAISYLEAAKSKLGQVSSGLKLLGGADVNEVKQEIAAKIQRLKVEDTMRKKLTPATKAFFKGQPPPQRGLKGIASKSLSAVTVLGKGLRVFRR